MKGFGSFLGSPKRRKTRLYAQWIRQVSKLPPVQNRRCSQLLLCARLGKCLLWFNISMYILLIVCFGVINSPPTSQLIKVPWYAWTCTVCLQRGGWMDAGFVREQLFYFSRTSDIHWFVCFYCARKQHHAMLRWWPLSQLRLCCDVCLLSFFFSLHVSKKNLKLLF